MRNYCCAIYAKLGIPADGAVWPAFWRILPVYLFVALLLALRRVDYRLRAWGLLLSGYAAGILALVRAGWWAAGGASQRLVTGRRCSCACSTRIIRSTHPCGGSRCRTLSLPHGGGISSF